MGGGVAILIRKNLSFRMMEDVTGMEALFCKVKFYEADYVLEWYTDTLVFRQL